MKTKFNNFLNENFGITKYQLSLITRLAKFLKIPGARKNNKIATLNFKGSPNSALSYFSKILDAEIAEHDREGCYYILSESIGCVLIILNDGDRSYISVAHKEKLSDKQISNIRKKLNFKKLKF